MLFVLKFHKLRINKNVVGANKAYKPGECFYAIITSAVFENHDEIAAISLKINDFAMFTHRLDIQNRELWVSFPTEPASSQDFRHLNTSSFLNTLCWYSICPI